jgi:RNA polymerase sigma-70 factor (ECF subfamily)
MGELMSTDRVRTEKLLARAVAGDEAALTELFDECRTRLWHMVRIRLDRRVQGRVDPSDVLQEAHIDLFRRIHTYDEERCGPFFLWLRQIVGQKLIDEHRKHLGAQIRDVKRDVSLHQRPLPQATSASLAAQLIGKWTAASRTFEREEARVAVQEALNDLDAVDREILSLRHFELLSNTECAIELGLSKSAASKRYLRALMRVKKSLGKLPGFRKRQDLL